LQLIENIFLVKHIFLFISILFEEKRWTAQILEKMLIYCFIVDYKSSNVFFFLPKKMIHRLNIIRRFRRLTQIKFLNKKNPTQGKNSW